MFGCDDAVFVDIHAMALNAAISGSILAVPEACFVMTMALPFGSTRALLTAYATRACPVGGGAISHSACCIARRIEMRTTRPRIQAKMALAVADAGNRFSPSV